MKSIKYTNGCLAAVKDSIKTMCAITGGIALGIALPIVFDNSFNILYYN